MKGFEQVHGLHVHETWAPTGQYTTLRFLLVICACDDLETMHLGIKCAFQNGKPHGIVCVYIPKFEYDSKETNTVVQWSEDVIKADPFFGRSRVRFRVPPWV